MLHPKYNVEWFEAASRLERERATISAAGLGSVRHAVRVNFPKLASPSFVGRLASPAPVEPLQTIVKELLPADRYDLAAQVTAYVLDVVYYKMASSDPYEKEDPLMIGLAEKSMHSTPEVKGLFPAMCWLVEHHQQMEEQLPEIIQECAPWAPGPTDRIRATLKSYIKQGAKKKFKGRKRATAGNKQAAHQQHTHAGPSV